MGSLTIFGQSKLPGRLKRASVSRRLKRASVSRWLILFLAEILGATPEAVRAFREIARPDLKDWHIILLKEEIARLRRCLEVKSRLNLTYLKALNRAKGRVKVC